MSPPVSAPAAPAPAPAWQVGRLQGFAGCAFGARYPALGLILQGGAVSERLRHELWASLVQVCPGLLSCEVPEAGDHLGWPESVTWLLTVWQRLQQVQGVPVFETGRVLALAHGQARCLLPVGARGHRSMARVVAATVGWLAAASSAGDASAELPGHDELHQAVGALSALAPLGSNVPRFVRAAYERGLPVMELPGSLVQYGVGSQARWLDSSFTDATPTIAAKLARNKVWAGALLAQAGLPVPQHFSVANADAAVQAAQRLGFPVVVKPADLDGGVGVAAGLENEEEVRQAFEAARKLSRHVLLEKHVHGRDYRLTVFQDEVIWAIERVPAGVLGDGLSTLVELVEQVNVDPRRGTGTHAPLKRLLLDEEAKALLGKQGLGLVSVPAPGQFVRLRRTANVASGGQPVAVTEQVHPDNARLAVRAAQVLGLDVAGIDLLIDDVSRSWRESGRQVAICEVNGQPNLGQTTAAHLYGQILERLVSGQGRVPTILVLGADRPAQWLDAFAGALQARGLRVGLAGPQGVCVCGELLTLQALDLYAAGRMLALNRQVDAMVLAITEDSVLKTGLPWARYDALVLAGQQMHLVTPSSPLEKSPARRWLHHLLPACDGVVVVHEAAACRVTGFETVTAAQLLEVSGAEEDVAKLTVQHIRPFSGGRI